jgi:hypothetical protein
MKSPEKTPYALFVECLGFGSYHHIVKDKPTMVHVLWGAIVGICGLGFFLFLNAVLLVVLGDFILSPNRYGFLGSFG